MIDEDSEMIGYYCEKLSRLLGKRNLREILKDIHYYIQHENLGTTEIRRGIRREYTMAQNRRIGVWNKGGRPSKVEKYLDLINYYRERGREDLARQTLTEAKQECSPNTYKKLQKLLEKQRWQNDLRHL